MRTLSSTPQTAWHSGYMTLPTPSKTSLHIPGDIGTELVEQVVCAVLNFSKQIEDEYFELHCDFSEVINIVTFHKKKKTFTVHY